MSILPSAVVLIPAAGRGRRMGEDVPKQYLDLQGQSILARTLGTMQESERIHAIVVAVHPEDRSRFAALVTPGLSKLRTPVAGGTERVDSVRRALAALEPGDDIVLVHDAVRPWVSTDLIAAVVDAAAQHGAAIAAVPATETVKQVEDGIVVATHDRNLLWNAQTPQGFRRQVLEDAFACYDGSVPATDEASLVERCGQPVRIVHGETTNMKVTTPQDLRAGTATELRIGQGFDVHGFQQGRALVLGGVRLDHPVGLAGHSDADVLTHAIIDALLGAAGRGDVGRLFPDTDPAYAGISSLVLLHRAWERLAGVGGRIVNIDAIVMAQAPRVAPYAEQISTTLAGTLGITVSQISVKATTTEGLGFVGRQEGIAAQAVALVRLPAA